MSVARMSCPQTLYPTLCSAQQPVDVEPVGVGCYLRHNPGRKPHQSLGQRAFDPEDPLERRERYLNLLPCAVLAGALGHQSDSCTGQRLTQLLASVRQIAKEPPRQTFPELRTAEQFTDQADFRNVGRGKFVGEGHTVCGAQQMQLHSIDGERSPPHPRRSLKALRLRNLARVQYFQERGVDEEGLGLSNQLGQDLPAQWLKVASESPHAPMQRGGVHPRDAREEVDKETLEVAQEGAFALGAPQLLEECQGDDLRVRELLERGVALPPRVEEGVGVIHEAEQDRDRLFQRSEGGSMLRVGHPRHLSLGIRMAPFLPLIHATDI